MMGKHFHVPKVPPTKSISPTATGHRSADPLPDKYKVLARQGIYGDFFSFYLCDLILKLNGKGGQPVYVKVAGQSTGRCAPK